MTSNDFQRGTSDPRSFLEDIDTLKRAWGLVFPIAPPADPILYRWLCLFPMRDVEVAFQKAASGQRVTGEALTMTQIQNRIQSTLYVLKQQREKQRKGRP